MNNKKYLYYISLFTLFLLGIIGYYIFFFGGHAHPNNILKVAYLDIGQGDAMYIEAPNGRQMMIDGGPGPIVLSRLASVMPFGDRSIDILLATHTDSDHIAGFPSVLDHYSVGLVFENGAINTTRTYTTLETSIKKHNVIKLIARRGTRIVLDQAHNIYIDILFPDRDISNFDSNDGSIVCKLVYGNESFMFTGDATKYTEHLIMHNEASNPHILQATVLKLGHHGSKYSSGEPWLEAVHPDTAIISAGLGNRYGHPAQEVLDRLDTLKIPYLSTLGKGTILFETDGVSLKEKQLRN